MKQFLVVLKRILFFCLVLSMSSFAMAEQSKPVVMYDKKSDLLSVTAQDSSYKEIMERVAVLSGIEILMDPKAEHTVTANIKELPLEKALTEISRQANVAYFYSDSKQVDKISKVNNAGKPVLIAMHVLPKGEAGNAALLPLLAPGGEAFMREQNRKQNTGVSSTPKAIDFAQQRWDERLKKMAPKKRDELLADAKAKIAEKEKHDAEKQQRREEHEQKEKERQARRDAARAANPELYKKREQQHIEAGLPIKPKPQNETAAPQTSAQ